MSKTLATVKSHSNPKVRYSIRRGSDNVIYCTCIGWKNHGYCKHLTEFKARRSARRAS